MVTENIIERMAIVELPRDAQRTFFPAVASEKVSGGRVYDAHIAETARRAGARIVVTDNRRHFIGLMRYGIRVLTAAEFVEEYRL
jgi:predicted nucleic acid-binding protein